MTPTSISPLRRFLRLGSPAMLLALNGLCERSAQGFSCGRSGGSLDPCFPLGSLLNKQIPSFRAKRGIPLRSMRLASHPKFPVIPAEVARPSLRHLPNPDALPKEVL